MPSNRGGGIPIPSFASAVDVSPSVNGSPGTTTNSSSVATVPARWKEASLLQLEVSLQHWFHKQGASRAGKITLDEFYALVRKLDWSQFDATNNNNTEGVTGTETTNDNDNDKKPQEDTKIHPHDALLVSHLTKEERLLHDLVCLTANPSLAKNNNALYTIDLDTGTLEPRQSSAEKLKRLMASTKFLEEHWSSQVCAMIQKHREKKARLLEKAASLKDNRPKQPLPTIQAIITEGMTVDERVRARVKAKQQNEEQSQQQTQGSSSNPMVAALNNDRTWIIQLADALWNHARTVVQRRNQHVPTKLASNSLFLAESNNNNKRQRPDPRYNPTCTLTFKDAIECIAKSRIGEASATQIAKALTELATFTPKYITVFKQEQDGGRAKKKGKNNNANGNSDNPAKKQSFKWSLGGTTILVRPDRYPSVRSQLTGEPMPTAAKSKINIVTDTNPKTTMAKTAAPATTTPPATAAAAAPNRKRPSPVLAKNLLDDFAAVKAHEAKRSKMTTTAVVPSTPASSSYFSNSKSTTASLPNNNSKKREHESMAASTTSPTHHQTGSPNPKQKKRLRINWENVIIEEDRTGGIVLPPSERLGASPRSLNSLFRKLKKGERI